MGDWECQAKNHQRDAKDYQKSLRQLAARHKRERIGNTKRAAKPSSSSSITHEERTHSRVSGTSGNADTNIQPEMEETETDLQSSGTSDAKTGQMNRFGFRQAANF